MLQYNQEKNPCSCTSARRLLLLPFTRGVLAELVTED